MLYITLDTCVWLKLLYIDFQNEDNYLEEICYWIENKFLTHIVPTNIIDEWNRHKNTYQNDIVNYFKKKETENIKPYIHNKEIASTVTTIVDEIQKSVEKRIQRIDNIFFIYSEKAPYDDTILKEAAIKNLHSIAPNHKKDSYRDTVNIMSLIQFLKLKGYSKSIFTTLNYKDFSADSGSKCKLHNDLISDFSSVNLEYEYFGENDYFGTKLFNELRKELSSYSYQTFLKEKKKQNEEDKRKNNENIITENSNPDTDFLDNLRYIDNIIVKDKRTSVDEEIIKMLITRHESYKQYFFKNLGNDGLV